MQVDRSGSERTKEKTKTEKKEKERKTEEKHEKEEERKNKKIGKECLVEYKSEYKNQIMNTIILFCYYMCICTFVIYISSNVQTSPAAKASIKGQKFVGMGIDQISTSLTPAFFTASNLNATSLSDKGALSLAFTF